ncbi:hypothetical protein HYALB_00002862 [Hymenoscyphus albidus]|uniref:Nephrocystin 3-like N-terminal domain-containing protein n=1 Tax=Hymenoscyphus albidus TaxID=595503 RepID=A0A9N9LL80_9HELO|nr:hypothetical protein HYALB_00002862 [Hymenoscyphus albidus]
MLIKQVRPITDEDTGLRVLHKPVVEETTENQAPIIDIVAIHGIGAHPVDTWCKKVGTGETSHYVNWLEKEDMLPSVVPNARIMRYGYMSRWYGDDAIRQKATTVADRLLISLKRKRRGPALQSRSLIFVAHCFGGLAVLQALLNAERFPDDWPGIYSATCGIVFLGTPFRGAPGLTLSELLKAVDAEYQDTIQGEILRILEPDDESLLEMVHVFEKIQAKSLQRANIICFFEQKPCNVKAILGKEEKKSFAVLEGSGCLGLAQKIGLQRNHFDINKFGKPTDEEYLTEGSGILWIKGKPGSGKSTLLEFLLRHFKKQALYQESIQLSFFLHGRGTVLQKSRLGMYRSLLHQLLRTAPTAQAEFRHAFQERSRSQGDPGEDWNWHTNELRTFFVNAVEHVAKTQPVNIFVDALDEANDGTSDQKTSYQIVSDFHDLNDLLCRQHLRSTICFSCRHFPIVADNQGRDICVENENHKDISDYVYDELHRRLSVNEIEKQYLVELQNTIVERAQGVFQWATLAVGLAVQHHNNGIPSDEISQMLAKVPEELGGVYRHILSEVVDKNSYKRTLRLMRCVYLAERPLTVTEIYFAMYLPDTEVLGVEPSRLNLSLPTYVVERQITSLSGGLIELRQHDKNQIIQFIHQSVNDFILRDGLQLLDELDSQDLIGQGHYQLSLICGNYMKMSEIVKQDRC